MPSKKKGAVARSDEQIVPLTDLITTLDSVRAYRRRSSQNLEEKFRRLGEMGYSDLRKLWWEIEDDVNTIVDMPLKIPRVPRLIRLNLYLRLTSRLFFILLVIVLATRIVRAWRPLVGDFGQNIWLLIVVVLGSVFAMNGEVVVDYLIRRKVVQYEKETEQRYSKNVLKLKKATQTVIDRLVGEVGQGRKDPRDFPFYVFYDDYDRIEITASKTPRSMFIFKKKYKVFTAIPKLD